LIINDLPGPPRPLTGAGGDEAGQGPLDAMREAGGDEAGEGPLDALREGDIMRARLCHLRHYQRFFLKST